MTHRDSIANLLFSSASGRVSDINSQTRSAESFKKEILNLEMVQQLNCFALLFTQKEREEVQM